MAEFTHFNEAGRARMVDVSAKASTERVATAQAKILLQPETLEKIQQRTIAKGDVLAVAQVAGVMGAKKTGELIPLCHPLALSHVDVELSLVATPPTIRITSEVATTGQTGVEMEALVAVSVALLTVYDMVKAADKRMRIGKVRLTFKSGGKSGTFRAS